MKTDKKSEKKLGKLRTIVHKHDCWYTVKESMIVRLDKMIKSYSVHTTGFGADRYKAYVEIKKLAVELELTDDEYYQICLEERTKINESVRVRTARNSAEETRDNKGVYVGSGNSHQNKVRYPRKARSKRVWNIFYKMFPSLAEKDGWNGETSAKTI
jgi:hypothetical protein